MRPFSYQRRIILAAFTMAFGGALSCSGRESGGPPEAEFIVSAGDSTYWVRSTSSGITIRGSPMVLARLGGNFRELYVVDEDRSFENAIFVGQRLYQRDLVTGDSTEIFRDTLVSLLADDYERLHPEARRLAPDEEAGEEPERSAIAELSVLGVHGPYLSIEYHVDTSGAGEDAWHMTRHIVLDMRSGRPADLSAILGRDQAAAVIQRGRSAHVETVDSVRRDRRPSARRAARAITQFRFDSTSFSLAAPNGTLMIAFAAPGGGVGGEGFVLPTRPIPVTAPEWFTQAREALPSSTREREELWDRGSYVVKATYDTSARPAQIAIADSGGGEFAVGEVDSPVHRIYWLDRPAIDRGARAALSRAFDEAALYDDETRAAARGNPESFVLRSASFKGRFYWQALLAFAR